MAEKIDLGNVKGKDGVSITSLETIRTDDPQVDILRITLSNEEVFDYEITNNKYITLVNEIVDDDMSVPTSRALLYALDEFFGSYYPKTESDLRYARLVHSHIKEEITDFSVNLEPSANNLVDLNDIRDTGFYYVIGNASTQYVSNMPRADSSFYLIVEGSGSRKYVKQTWTHYNQNDTTVYIRTCNGGNWGNWYPQDNYVHEYITSTHNSSTNEWTGTCEKIKEIKKGTVIYYYLNQNPSSSSTTLNLTLPTNDGGTTTTGAKNVLMMTGDNITNKFPKGSVIGMVFTGYNWYVISPTIPNSDASAITMDGSTALAGSSHKYARADHRHPSDSSKADNIHPHETTDITHPSALSHLNTDADATQSAINTAIDSKLGSINTTISNQGAIVVDSQLTQSSTNPVESKAIYSAIQNKIEQGDIKGGTNICKGTPISNTNAGGTAYTVDSSTFHERPVYHIDNISKTSSQYSDIGFDISSNNFTNDDVFTFSFYIKGTSGKNFKTYFYGSNSIPSKRLVSNSTVTTNMNVGSSYGDGATEFALTSDWKKYYVTYHLQSSGGTASATKRVIVRVYGTSEAYVSNIQLERGYNATDYSDSDLAKADVGHTHMLEDIGYTDNYQSSDGINYNDITTQGTYKVWATAQVNSTNKPPNDTQGGLLVVNNIPNGTLQILYNYYKENPQIYYRIYHTTRGWSSWQTLSVDGHTHNSTDIKSIHIPSGDDLNTYQSTGFYYNNSNTEAQNITNIPESGKAFFLVVEDLEASNYTKQTITHYSTGKTYTRIRNAGNWGAWKQLINIDNASSTAPLVDYYKTGAKVGTSTNYARADHQHTPFFSYCTGGETTACYVNLLEISVTESWNDRPITLTLQQRAMQTPTYVSIKLTNVNISTTDYAIDKFVIWGNPMTLYLKQIATNKWHLIAHKPANDSYYIYDLFSGNGAVEFVGKNTKWGSSAPTNETNAPLYTATYLVGVTPFESTSSNIKANGTASVGSLNTVARADHIHPHNCVNNLTSTSTTAPLSANQGKTLNDTKVNVSDIKDNLTSTDTNKPLSAKQGKVLNDTKVNTSSIVNNLTSSSTTAPLSANQGRILNGLLTNSFTKNGLENLETDLDDTYVATLYGKPLWDVTLDNTPISSNTVELSITEEQIKTNDFRGEIKFTNPFDDEVELILHPTGTLQIRYLWDNQVMTSTIQAGAEESIPMESNEFLMLVINSNNTIDYEVKKTVTKVNTLVDIIYPVGSVYMTMSEHNPTMIFGGAWVRIKDRFLLGASDTYEALGTGGSKDAVVVSHNHTQDAHSHEPSNTAFSFLASQGDIKLNESKRSFPSESSSGHYFVYSDEVKGINEYATTNPQQPYIYYSGESGTGKNMPPYIGVFMWWRFA